MGFSKIRQTFSDAIHRNRDSDETRQQTKRDSKPDPVQPSNTSTHTTHAKQRSSFFANMKRAPSPGSDSLEFRCKGPSPEPEVFAIPPGNQEASTANAYADQFRRYAYSQPPKNSFPPTFAAKDSHSTGLPLAGDATLTNPGDNNRGSLILDDDMTTRPGMSRYDSISTLMSDRSDTQGGSQVSAALFIPPDSPNRPALPGHPASSASAQYMPGGHVVATHASLTPPHHSFAQSVLSSQSMHSNYDALAVQDLNPTRSTDTGLAAFKFDLSSTSNVVSNALSTEAQDEFVRPEVQSPVPQHKTVRAPDLRTDFDTQVEQEPSVWFVGKTPGQYTRPSIGDDIDPATYRLAISPSGKDSNKLAYHTRFSHLAQGPASSTVQDFDQTFGYSSNALAYSKKLEKKDLQTSTSELDAISKEADELAVTNNIKFLDSRFPRRPKQITSRSAEETVKKQVRTDLPTEKLDAGQSKSFTIFDPVYDPQLSPTMHEARPKLKGKLVEQDYQQEQLSELSSLTLPVDYRYKEGDAADAASIKSFSPDQEDEYVRNSYFKSARTSQLFTQSSNTSGGLRQEPHPAIAPADLTQNFMNAPDLSLPSSLGRHGDLYDARYEFPESPTQKTSANTEQAVREAHEVFSQFSFALPIADTQPGSVPSPERSFQKHLLKLAQQAASSGDRQAVDAWKGTYMFGSVKRQLVVHLKELSAKIDLHYPKQSDRELARVAVMTLNDDREGVLNLRDEMRIDYLDMAITPTSGFLLKQLEDPDFGITPKSVSKFFEGLGKLDKMLRNRDKVSSRLQP